MEKIAFVFPGQGSQHIGMAKSLYDEFILARQTFEEASDVLGCDFAKLCFEGNLTELSRMENMQPALLLACVTAFRVYMKEIGIAPQFCAGHSLGEYSALTCAGALSFGDALKIIRQRGFLSQTVADEGTGAMTIIEKVESRVIEEECVKISQNGRKVSISCYNSPFQVAVSGDREAVLELEDRAVDLGGQITPLLMSPPFHCHLMKQAADQLKGELEKYNFRYLRYPVIANVTGVPYDGKDNIPEILSAQLIKPVRWNETMNYMQKKGITLIVELGPKNVLSSLARMTFTDMEAVSFGQKEDRLALSEFVFSDLQMKKHIPTVITKCLSIAVSTPNLNWNDEEYMEGVIKPYKQISDIQEMLEKEGSMPTIEQMRTALDLLKTVFQTKRLPEDERREWFDQILDETGTRYLFSDI